MKIKSIAYILIIMKINIMSLSDLGPELCAAI